MIMDPMDKKKNLQFQVGYVSLKILKKAILHVDKI